MHAIYHFLLITNSISLFFFTTCYALSPSFQCTIHAAYCYFYFLAVSLCFSQQHSFLLAAHGHFTVIPQSAFQAFPSLLSPFLCSSDFLSAGAKQGIYICSCDEQRGF